MPSKKPVIAVRTNSEVMEKIKYISYENNRSISKEVELLIKEHIKTYEKYKGEIKLGED